MTGPSGSSTLTTVICNYNHGRLISRAIDAMLTQSRPADEFIIVDDGSTDDSVQVIQSWVGRNPQIRFLQNERNIGFHASFQRAITAATGDFVYSGAADDRVLPGFFEGAMRLANAYPATGVICGQMIHVDSAGRPVSLGRLSTINEPGFLDPSRYLQDVLFKEPATLSLSGGTIFRRQPLIEIGGCRVELGSWGDTFAIQALGRMHGFCYWPQPAMEYATISGSISDKTRSDPRRALRILDRAEKLMRSDQFRALFPQEYVRHWTSGFRQAIAHQELSSVIDANQQLQAGCREVAQSASLPIRCLIGGLQLLQRTTYFLLFRMLRAVVNRQLNRLADEERAGSVEK